MGENIRDALNLEYYSALKHVQCMTYLEQNHCPLDAQAIKELKAHYTRPWDRSNKVAVIRG